MSTVSKSRPKRTRRPAVKAKASAPKAAPLAHVQPPAPTEPSHKPLPDGPQRYYPELAEWSYPIDSTRENASGVFHIRNEIGTRGSGRIPGEIVATVTVAPGFNQNEAKSIATMMASAPDLWRKLRERSRFDELDPTGMEEMNDIHATLWQAARRNPFGRHENSEDEILYRRQMNQWAQDHGRPEPFKDETPPWAK